MKLELSHLLHTCLAHNFTWSSLSFDEVWLSIENPPKRVEAEYSSTLAFEIAAQAKRKNRVVADWEPTDVAQRIAADIGESTPLVIETSARGHLNVLFERSWCQNFFDSVTARGGASLVSAESLVTETSPIPATLNLQDSLILRSVAVFPIRAQRLLVDELLEQFGDFLVECGVSYLELEPAETLELSDRSLQLLLARLANPELDSMAIRLGLHGSENIPWLLEEFSRAWRLVARGRKQQGVRQDFGQAGAEIRLVVPTFGVSKELSVLRAWKEVDFCSATLHWLARARGAFLTVDGAVNREYFRAYFSHLMQGVKLFFGFYSHPSNRVAPADSTRLLVKLLGEAVEEAARAVCQGAPLGLDVKKNINL